MMKTSIYTVLCIAIRLGAVWLGANAILLLPSAYAAVLHGTLTENYMMIVLVWSAVVLLIAFLLWVYPGLLARITVGKSSMEVFESPISHEQIQYIALSILGMWFVMSGLIQLTYEVMRVWFFSQETIDAGRSFALNGELLSKPIIEILLGGILVMGSRGLSGLLDRIRGRSVPSPSIDADIENESERRNA